MRMPVPNRAEAPRKRWTSVLIALLIVLACTRGGGEFPKANPGNLRVGETVHVCGCPMMCCNTISRTGDGRCDCNQPLRKGTVTKIQNGRVHVMIDDGREKRFFVGNR